MVKKRGEDREGGKVGEGGRQRRPSDTCHSQFGLWTSVARHVAAPHCYSVWWTQQNES